jgi:hypothetical protein
MTRRQPSAGHQPVHRQAPDRPFGFQPRSKSRLDPGQWMNTRFTVAFGFTLTRLNFCAAS